MAERISDDWLAVSPQRAKTLLDLGGQILDFQEQVVLLAHLNDSYSNLSEIKNCVCPQRLTLVITRPLKLKKFGEGLEWAFVALGVINKDIQCWVAFKEMLCFVLAVDFCEDFLLKRFSD